MEKMSDFDLEVVKHRVLEEFWVCPLGKEHKWEGILEEAFIFSYCECKTYSINKQSILGTIKQIQ